MENKKVEEVRIEARDFYGDNCLVDTVNKSKPVNRKPEGEVHIFEVTNDGKKKLVHKSNLVLYLGRETLAQRLVNQENSSVTPTKDEFLSWFGIGDGGVLPADPLDPTPPVSTDNDLSSNVMISDSTSSYGDYHVAGGDYPTTGFYKKQFDSITFQQDSYNDNRWLILKVETTIGVNDANGSQLSEAGLFTAESNSAAYNGQFSIFARVTFPSLIKTSDRRLIFDWYLYV
ncbi:MAG: hypothetical protein ACFFG0_02105 [Candidatus Thorarchaeota archaeon]